MATLIHICTKPIAEDCTSTFSQLEMRVLYVLILTPRKYSQELMDIVLDHWKRSRRKSIKYTFSDHSIRYSVRNRRANFQTFFCENIKNKYDKAKNTRLFLNYFSHTSKANYWQVLSILPSDNNQKLHNSHHVHCCHPGPFLASIISLLIDMSASTLNPLQSMPT